MKPKINAQFHSESILEQLESRQLFSGGIEGIVPENNEQNEAVHREMEVNTEQNITEDSASIVTDLADNLTHELVFIDTDVENYEQILNDILAQDNEERNIEVILLDNQGDGIEQISETLANYNNLDAVHLISHGDDGNIDIGNKQLNSDTLNQNLSEISGWGDAFSEQGDFLIYGCNLAESEDGQSLVQSLSSLTHTDVAASDDLTGHKSLGGDWELEYNTGTIETDIAVSTETQQSWNAVLAETVYESNTNVDNDVEIKNNATWGQSFSHNSGNGTYTVNQISLEIYKLASANSQTITVTLSETWNGGSLGSATISSDSLTTSYASYSFDFADVTLTDGTTYYIKIATDSNSGKVYAGGDDTGSYANGFKINHAGNTVTSKDIAFALKYNHNNSAATIGGDVSYSGNEGDMVSGTLTATDIDGLTDNTYFTVTTQTTNGTAAIDATTGAWSFTPFDNNWFGNDSFTITVTDDLGGTTTQAINISLANVNDAATVSSATVNLIETDTILTSSGTLTSTDVDNPDNTFTANTIVGTIGTFNINAAGAWDYTANSAYDSLNSGDSVSETFNLTSIDGTASTVQITINGTDDAATVSSATLTLTETDTILTSSGTLTSTDVDNPDNTFTANTIVGTIGTFNINAAGAWDFTANSAYDSLNSGDSVSETFNLTSIDGTASTVQININGSDDAATVSSATLTLTETDTTLTSSGTLTSTDVDNPDNTFTANTIVGTIGTFNINATGAWDFTASSAYDSLNSGDSVNETFNLTSIDGTASTVQITINGTDDAATVSSATVTPTKDSAPSFIFDNYADAPLSVSKNTISNNVLINHANTETVIESDANSAGHILVETKALSTSIFDDSITDENTNDTELIVDITNETSDDPNYEIKKSTMVHKPELLLMDLDKFNLQTNDNSNGFELSNSNESENLRDNIDLMREQMNTDHDRFEKQDIEIEIIMGATVSMTAGFVNWVLRSGALLSSLLSSVSLFSQFDPLTVVSNNTKKTDNPHKTSLNQEQNNVEAMFDK